jgi:hypothetical protein
MHISSKWRGLFSKSRARSVRDSESAWVYWPILQKAVVGFPGFPAEFGGVVALHAAFLTEKPHTWLLLSAA